MSLLLVAGARPNFMKVAPILRAARARGLETVLVHTGQHYDPEMSDNFFRDLGIGPPDVSLDVRSGTHAQQTARVMERIEPVIVERRPEWVVVVGDVNSTLAAALVTAKLPAQIGARLAHVEAGLRSRDCQMPEEVNRVLTDRLSDLLLTPSADAAANLASEGIPSDRIRFVGNVMIDSLLHQLPRSRDPVYQRSLGLDGKPYVLVTLHRPSNVDDSGQLALILRSLVALAKDIRVIFVLHPRTRERILHFGLAGYLEGVTVLAPTGYAETVALEDGAAAVLTDSGGLQEETTVLGVPCLTLRAQTERPVTVTAGTNSLAPWPLTFEGLTAAARTTVNRARVAVGACAPEGWDGKASERVIDALTMT